MRVCELTGKRRNKAHNVSHAHNKSRKWQQPNLQWKRIFIPEEGRFIRLRLSTRVIRTVNQLGLQGYCQKHGIDYGALVRERLPRG